MLLGYFLQVGYMPHSNHSLGILNFMSELLNEQQKIDLSDFFPGWQHVQQKKRKQILINLYQSIERALVRRSHCSAQVTFRRRIVPVFLIGGRG